jgi:pyruvate/2-oxoglutarate/acetoin dehydrogenase E1 component
VSVARELLSFAPIDAQLLYATPSHSACTISGGRQYARLSVRRLIGWCVRGCSRRHSGSLLIYVLSLTGERVPVWTEPTHKIGLLKERIMDLEGVPVDQQRLLFAGVWLVHQNLASSY